MRGIAICMMITFHFLYDLNYFEFIHLDVFKGFWGYFGKLTFTIFLLLVGISLTLSYSRRQKEKVAYFYVYLMRGIKVFLWGMMITLATYILIPDNYVQFGVLHLIGVSIILSYPLLRYKYTNLILGIVVAFLGMYFLTLTVPVTWLFWIGLLPNVFRSVDYFPIFPYWSIILFGIFIGKVLYKNFVRTFYVPPIGKNPIIKSLSFLGRHSLVIYLIHQPLLIFLLIMV